MLSADVLFSTEELCHGAVVHKEGALRIMIERMRMWPLRVSACSDKVRVVVHYMRDRIFQVVFHEPMLSLGRRLGTLRDAARRIAGVFGLELGHLY